MRKDLRIHGDAHFVLTDRRMELRISSPSRCGDAEVPKRRVMPQPSTQIARADVPSMRGHPNRTGYTAFLSALGFFSVQLKAEASE
jgi:hypothetical protein